MTTTFSVSTQPNTISFQGKGKDALRAMGKCVKCPKKFKRKPIEIVEQSINNAKNIELVNKRSKDEIKEIILRESTIGNTDFVRQINELLSKDMAKNVYKK